MTRSSNSLPKHTSALPEAVDWLVGLAGKWATHQHDTYNGEPSIVGMDHNNNFALLMLVADLPRVNYQKLQAVGQLR